MHDFIERLGRDIVDILAPGRVLRAGINLRNFLLVTGHTSGGHPVGNSPDRAQALAGLLGADVHYVCYESPGLVADAAERDEWDVALIGAEPQRAAVIAFTPAYTEIEASYLVPEGPPIREIAQVDRPGIRIAVTDRTAYGLWLDRNIAFAELVRTGTIDEAAQLFAAERLEARRAAAAPHLGCQNASEHTHARRPLHGRAAGGGNADSQSRRSPLPAEFVRGAIESGFVASLIEKRAVDGLTVATSGSS